MQRNDPAQYDQLADQWWDPRGGFAMLQWIAASRAGHVPPAATPGAVLVDLACGGGLMAPHVQRLGYRHVGVDIGLAGLQVARRHGVSAVRGSVLAVPLADGCADVVTAGEILEHVADPGQVLAESARLLKPGGLLVVDSIAASWLAPLVAVRIAERLPGGPPPGIHDPALFVDRRELLATARGLGLYLRLVGLRPSVRDLVAWRRGRRDGVRMRTMPWTGILFAGTATKSSAGTATKSSAGTATESSAGTATESCAGPATESCAGPATESPVPAAERRTTGSARTVGA